MSELYQTKLPIHLNIIKKLDGFITNGRIPHILFHGASGTGKKTIVYDFVNKIYNNDKSKIRTNVMYVNCAHGKGIKFIRDELKFFAKTNIQGTKGIQFKTIVLFNADSLTIDAQSAMRRCIESFSHNTRFFIVVENKHKMLNPILSRFCEIYIPDNVDENGKIQNLHQYHLEQVYGKDIEYIEWFNDIIGSNLNKTDIEFIKIVNNTYDNAFSTIDFINWIKQCSFLKEKQKCEIVMYFHKIKSEYRNEKLLMLTILSFIKKII
tara:strand:+ start:19309 stop:20103 length:795 start_codon:yes stop_codon:yes gene_type:complete